MFTPNTTQTPNELFDHWLPHLSESELKVLLVVFRKTFGWHKVRDRISISQLCLYTGLGKDAVINAGKTLHQKGLIIKEVIGPNGRQETYFELVMNNESNNSYPSELQTPPSRNSEPPPVGNSDTQNKNKTKTKEDYVKDNVSPKPKVQKNQSDRTMIYKSKKEDNVSNKSLPEKYKLNDDQKETFRYLKTLNIDSDDATICWWSKNYSLARILEVYKASEGKKSVGAYMNKLLKVQACVAKAHSHINREFAEEFKKSIGWHNLSIGNVYVTFSLGNDIQDLSLNMEPIEFAEHLMRKHEIIYSMKREN